jgi:hypothetical protein
LSSCMPWVAIIISLGLPLPKVNFNLHLQIFVFCGKQFPSGLPRKKNSSASLSNKLLSSRSKFSFSELRKFDLFYFSFSWSDFCVSWINCVSQIVESQMRSNWFPLTDFEEGTFR